MFQLPNVNSQLERMKEVLKMDLSTIVQKVTIANSTGLTWNFYFNGQIQL